MKILGYILQYLPYVLNAVVGVEGAIQAPGATKKAIILNSITAAASVGETVPNNLAAGLSAVIDNTVAELNKSGIFGKDSTGASVVNAVPTVVKA